MTGRRRADRSGAGALEARHHGAGRGDGPRHRIQAVVDESAASERCGHASLDSMKIARIHEHGGADVLRYEDAPEPRIRANQVLVRVRATALNHLDLFVRAGLPGVKIPMPHILGSDIAGEIVETGDLCDRVQPGWRVLLSPGLSCRQCEQCLSGNDNLCRRYTLFGYGVDGGNAELLAAPEYSAIRIPDELSFEEAAAAPLVFLTAWHMLITRARLQPGEDVLVLAASSGVGSAAIQIARLFQCRVIATAGNEEKCAKARELGAAHTIDHYREDTAAVVKKITGKRGVDVVFEHVGQATWAKSLEALAPGGRVVTCGATTGYDARVDLRYLFTRQWSVVGSFMGGMGELHQVLKFVFRGQLKPVIDRVYPMAQIRAAHERLENKEQFGKVVLLP
jgi:NADPH:quinone reductase-like Zn-dependent oxidoreductase